MLILANFEVDGTSDNAYFLGFHDPKQNWNGWAIPHFGYTECGNVLRNCLNANESFKFIEQEFVVNYEEGQVIYTPSLLKTNEGYKKLWSIGGYEWTWREVII